MKVLIISHFFPPLNRMASARVYSFAKYLSSDGMDVTVFTSKKSLLYGPIDKMKESHDFDVIDLGGGIANFPLVTYLYNKSRFFKSVLVRVERLFWVLSCILKIILTKKSEYDVVISSFGPVSSIYLGFLAKAFCKSRYWVLDYRDLWHNNPYSAKKPFVVKMEKHIESFLLKRVDDVVSISSEMCKTFSDVFNINDEKIHLIYNGFDSKVAKKKEEIIKKINVIHTGTIYTGKRDPSPLFRAINELHKDGTINKDDIEIVFYGDRLGNVMSLADKYHVSDFVRLEGSVSMEVSLKLQREASLLLLLSSSDKKSRGVLTGKIFEYISSGSPILGVGVDNKSAIYSLLVETGAGVCASEVEKIKEIILEVKNNEFSWFNPNKSVIEKYSRNNQIKKLIKLISTYENT